MLVRDSFDRADDTASLGTADVGGVWLQAIFGSGPANFGIQSQKAYVFDDAPTPADFLIATLDTLVDAHRVRVTADMLPSPTGSYVAAVVGNYVDENNFSAFMVFFLADVFDPFTGLPYQGTMVAQVSAGVLLPRQINFVPIAGGVTEISAVFRPGSVTGYVNGVLTTSGPVIENLDAIAGTRAGFMVLGGDASDAVTFDDFLADVALAPNPVGCGAWTTLEDATDCCSPSVSATVLAETVRVASELLYVLSGRQFTGNCTKNVRPCRRALRNDHPLTPLQHERAYNALGQLVEGWNDSWGVCDCGWIPNVSACSCGGYEAISLGEWPLVSIDQVLIDGVPLPSSAYVIHDEMWLVRVDGQAWPCCQDQAQPTFEVTFTFGIAPPRSGKLAAEKLACELALACAGSDQCRLPKRVQSITRQGVSMVLLDPFDFLNSGRTGVYEVDLFLKAFNPEGETDVPVVFSPDVPIPGVTQTWP